MLTREELMDWTIVELKEYCKVLGLRVAGPRVQLVDRIHEKLFFEKLEQTELELVESE